MHYEAARQGGANTKGENKSELELISQSIQSWNI